METNWIAVIAAALVTLPIGFIWYNPKVFGTVWMRESGMTEEKAKGANMAKVFGLAVVFSFILAFFLPTIVIHQMGALQLTGGNPEAALPSYHAFIADYATNFRTFKHGALHGSLLGLFVVLPTMAINALFERKSAKYVLINAGYFIVSLAIMGGIICQWGTK